MKYKLIISRQGFYREIELAPDVESCRIGTNTNCEVRLRKDLFFEQIELQLTQRGDNWVITCSDNLYFFEGNVKKLSVKTMINGENFELRYRAADNKVFDISYIIDFENLGKKYDRSIDISAVNRISIGSRPDCNLALYSKYVIDDDIIIERVKDSLKAKIIKTTFGFYHNGNKEEFTAVIRNGDFFSVSDFLFYYKNNTLWTENRKDLAINQIPFKNLPDMNTYPMFRKNTRIKKAIDETKIEILDPPAIPKKNDESILTRLLPSLGMIAAAAVMAMRGGLSMLLFAGVSAVTGISTAIINIVQKNKKFKEESENRIIKYNKYISEKKQEIAQKRMEEHDILEHMYKSQSDILLLLERFAPDLFDRRPSDDDFLCVRLGTGDVESKREINYKKQERLEVEDDLQLIPEQICAEYRKIPDSAIICDFKNINAIGIVGMEADRFSLMKNIIIDIAARQYYTDVRMMFVTEPENSGKMRWVRLLPHAYVEELGVRGIVSDNDSKAILFEYLYKELTRREGEKNHGYHIVVFFYDDYGFRSHPLSKFIDEAKNLGVTFVFLKNDKSEVMPGCDYIVDIHDRNAAVLINTADMSSTSEFRFPQLNQEKAKEIISLLAPVYTEEISLEGSLRKNYSMYEMLNILEAEDIDLNERWGKSQVFKSMAAPIGISKSGMVFLDLHDKAHGPHGLVAGTTGSGKSEILQTYILSMATIFHPHEVGFVIIDFKGGGMVNQFRTLPHLIGAITNIDGKEINRSLKSIKAELLKRQRYFDKAEVNHIDKYIKKYKNGEVREPLPHLIIIVDEFAELKAEQPEFMKKLISAARIGRSLGVHLILATQKPSGQVNEQIWSNSRFKLCLKVQDAGDSNEVIKSPLAAEIKEPGRAYLQVGNNEIFELFQSAYSGGNASTDESEIKEFSIYSISDFGKKYPVFVQKKEKRKNDENFTQLDAIVKYIGEYCTKKIIKKLPDICLPSLSDVICFSGEDKRNDEHVWADIGFYDDPDNQFQGPYSVNLSEQNLMIIGSAQTGKSNILQNIIRSVSTNYSPEEVNFYILDFASMVLKNFEALNHVGDVVCSSEDEKLKNLFKLLNKEISTRKTRLASLGLSSFQAYKEAGNRDLPQIIVIIDNLTALKELYFQDDYELLSLCRECLSVGITMVISNPQTSGIGYKYLSNFAGRIALYCNDSNEYNCLFDHCHERIDSIPGRAIVEQDKQLYECQMYLSFNGEKEIDRVKEIQKFIKGINSNSEFLRKAAHIPIIPDILTENAAADSYGSLRKNRYDVIAGLDYATVEPLVLDLANIGLLSIVGRDGAGKHNWLEYVLSVLSSDERSEVKVYVIDGIGKRLSYLKNKGAGTEYSILPSDGAQYIKDIEAKLKERYDSVMNGNDDILEQSELLMLVLDNMDAINAICTDSAATAAYKNIIGKYRNMNVCIITLCVDNANISYSAPEMLKNIKDNKNYLYFDDIKNLKLFDPPLAMSKAFKKPVDIGDAYYMKDTGCVKLKTPLHVK